MTIVTIEIDGSGAIVLRGAEDVSCPVATQNIAANLEARDSAINIANYGPLDPTQENADYWGAAADRWDVSVEEVKTARCGNCAAFNITSRIRACIADGVSGPDTWLGATDLGYCEVFGFKCASARRCDAWVQGGPLTDELAESMEPQPGDEDEYDDAAQATKIAAPGWMRANARRGIEWVNEGEGGDGLTPQTMREARAMAGGSVSDDKAMRMAAWFARHMVDLDAPAATVGADGYPSPGVVAHALWGGGSKTDSKRAAAWARAHRNGAAKASVQPRVPAGSRQGGQFGAGSAGGGTGVAGDGGAGGGTSEPKQITDEAEIQQAEEDVANWPNDGSYEQDMAQALAMGSLSDALTGEMMPAMTYVKRGADGKVVAVSQIDGESKTRVTVNYLAVSPASQGQGLGRQMMAHATEIAVEQGKGLSLSPVSSAVPFYEKIGMQLAPVGARDEGTMSFSKMRAKEFFMRNPQKAARDILNAEIDSLEPISGLFAIPGETKASTQPRMPAGSRQGGQFGAGGGGAGGTGTAPRAFKAGQDEEINDALKQEQGAYIDALTKDQARSVSDYQQIETYEEVNGGLRGAAPLSPESQALVANLDSTIAGASMDTSTTVFRGVVDDSGALEQLKVGDTILEKAYSSTSPNPAVAEAFANDPYSSEGKPYVLQIEVPAKHPAIAADVVSNKLAGRDLVQTDPMTVELTGYTRLNEVILPRNLGMTVTAITKKESATYIKVSITK